MSNNFYNIEARSYGLGGVASHNFWVLRDDKGRVVTQLHGLATDRSSNQFKPIGFFKDRLGFYEFKTAENHPTFISTKQKSVPVYQGEKEDVLRRWENAACEINRLNEKDLDYSPFGILGLPIVNSNSAFHLFAKLMDLPCYRFKGVLEPGISNDLSKAVQD